MLTLSKLTALKLATILPQECIQQLVDAKLESYRIYVPFVLIFTKNDTQTPEFTARHPLGFFTNKILVDMALEKTQKLMELRDDMISSYYTQEIYLDYRCQKEFIYWSGGDNVLPEVITNNKKHFEEIFTKCALNGVWEKMFDKCMVKIDEYISPFINI